MQSHNKIPVYKPFEVYCKTVFPHHQLYPEGAEGSACEGPAIQEHFFGGGLNPQGHQLT